MGFLLHRVHGEPPGKGSSSRNVFELFCISNSKLWGAALSGTGKESKQCHKSHEVVGAFHVQVEENQTPYLLYYSSHTSSSMNTFNLHKCHYLCHLISMFLWSNALILSLLLLCISIHVLYIAMCIVYIYTIIRPRVAYTDYGMQHFLKAWRAISVVILIVQFTHGFGTQSPLRPVAAFYCLWEMP